VKLLRLFVLALLLPGCATHLTDAGRKIKVVDNNDSSRKSKCELLGNVVGRPASILSGGDYGVVYATYDARNRAAQFTGADTLEIVNNEIKSFGGEVTGIAYNCFTPRTALQSSVTASSQKREDPVKKAVSAPQRDSIALFEKAKKCQNKGGVWVNDSCVISIE
jgi:hypothetical protein